MSEEYNDNVVDLAAFRKQKEEEEQLAQTFVFDFYFLIEVSNQ